MHPSAVVDEGATIGPGSKVWHFCHVMGGAEIGADVTLGQGCFVANGAIIGDGCRIQNNVSVFEGVVLGEGVFCGPSMVFTNVLTPRAGVNRHDEFARTVVGRGVTLGANCTIVCGNSIGEYATVAAGAVVTRDVPPHRLVAGVPAHPQGWVCRCGEVLGFEPGERFGSIATCARCRERYSIIQDGLLRG
ncbi:MAG: N-acetyltransferase [Armatimonadetes bacterium]|nr:N-acetyltransferase [Armatimonadota bacterium]